MSDPREFRSSEFELSSAEGLPIRGTLVLPESPHALVVIIHGFKGFRQWAFFPWLSEQFAGNGVAACRFDMSRNGIGEDSETFDRLDLFEHDTYTTQLADLVSVNEYLDGEGLDELPRFFLGHSRGGAVAILGAASREDLTGVITWSSISSVDRWKAEEKSQWRRQGSMEVINQRTRQIMRVSTTLLTDVETNRDQLDITAAVRRLRQPLLAVHGEKDDSVLPEESRRLVSAAHDGSLVLIQSGTHTYGAIHPLVTVPAPLSLAYGVTRRFVKLHAESLLRKIQLSSLRGGVLPGRP